MPALANIATDNCHETCSVSAQNATAKIENQPNQIKGNQIIQPKLTIGSPNDLYEQEADSVANHVMRMPESNFMAQRKCTACEHEKEAPQPPIGEYLQRKPFVISPIIQKSGENTGIIANDTISNQIESSRGNGQPIDSNTKSFMENRMGSDFSNVKIHTDPNAIQLSQNLNAQAFTVGNDVFFNAGKYNPESDAGKHLLAHELTHTVQQGGNIQKNTNSIIQRAMKFELQTNNIIWKIRGKKADKLPRKYGPHDYLHHGKIGKAPTSTKDGSAIELQSEEGGFVEFETPKWFSSWCELKERIQEAVEMTDEISKSTEVDKIGGKKTVKYPFDTKRLLKSKVNTSGLSSKDSLVVQLIDPKWGAKIQASDAIELSQYESLLNEHAGPSFAKNSKKIAENVFNSVNTAKVPTSNVLNLFSFLEMIAYYITRGQTVPRRGEIAKSAFRLMSRTSFSSIYDNLLSKTEQDLFKKIIKDKVFLNEFSIDTKTKFFIDGHGHDKHYEGPTVQNWLKSIIGTGSDLLSPPAGGSQAMGRFGVEKTAGKKDTDLVKFEARGSITHGTSKLPSGLRGGEMLADAKNWVSFIEKIFKNSLLRRSRKGSTELKYDPKKCP
jgi:Domain of unknown function (DUF4157)